MKRQRVAFDPDWGNKESIIVRRPKTDSMMLPNRYGTSLQSVFNNTQG